jgi:hypothetical protein
MGNKKPLECFTSKNVGPQKTLEQDVPYENAENLIVIRMIQLCITLLHLPLQSCNTSFKRNVPLEYGNNNRHSIFKHH